MNKRIITLLAPMLLLTAGVAAPSPQDPVPQTAAQQAPAQPAAAPPATTPAVLKGPTVADLHLTDASLTTVIDQLARQLKINVQIDPKVQGSVTLNTYGDAAELDARNLLDFLLRINGAGMIQEGDIYRIVPMNDLVRQPISQVSNGASIPEDERTMLNLVFLKYVTVSEVSKILSEFADEHTIIRSYAPANLLFILDSRRDMKRLMDLIELFDSDTFAAQRVRLFEIQNTRPSELVKTLEAVLRSISLNSATSTVHFLPVDALNMLIATAPNPGVFDTIQDWIRKLDVPITSTSGVIDTYIYRVNYGRADCLAQALNQLYYPGPTAGYGAGGYGGYGAGSYGNQGFGGGGYGSGYGVGGAGGGYSGGVTPLNGVSTPYGSQNSFSGGFGGAGSCGSGLGGGVGGYGGGVNGGGGYGYPTFNGYSAQVAVPPVQTLGGGVAPIGGPATATVTTTTSTPGGVSSDPTQNPPRIVANQLDNNLLIQGTPQQYQSILKLLKELDRPPRQILLEAKVYSVAMTGSFSAGVESRFQAANGDERRPLGGITSAGATMLQAGALVGQSRQLLAFLNMSENRGNVTVISEPSLIATDSIPASINVGTQVPTLTGSLNSIGGTSAFASQGISSHNTGATLQVNARVNPSGVVTLMINQEISKAVPPAAGGIQTPSFDQQVVQTQITLHDGDTIAIGGIISETNSHGTTGFPVISRIPYFGALFGQQTYSKDRSELILFMTPHVIYDTTDLMEASDELKARVKKLRRYLPE